MTNQDDWTSGPPTEPLNGSNNPLIPPTEVLNDEPTNIFPGNTKTRERGSRFPTFGKDFFVRFGGRGKVTEPVVGSEETDPRAAYIERHRRRREFAARCDSIQKLAITILVVYTCIIIAGVSTWAVLMLNEWSKTK